MNPIEFLEAIYRVSQENPLHFADTQNQSAHINYLVGKIMVETKGQCDPELAMKVVKIIVEEAR